MGAKIYFENRKLTYSLPSEFRNLSQQINAKLTNCLPCHVLPFHLPTFPPTYSPIIHPPNEARPFPPIAFRDIASADTLCTYVLFVYVRRYSFHIPSRLTLYFHINIYISDAKFTFKFIHHKGNSKRKKNKIGEALSHTPISPKRYQSFRSACFI